VKLPDYKLIGAPRRFKNGHGQQAKYYAQRFRLLSDSVRKIRSVSLLTVDKTVARRRAVVSVEEKVRKLTFSRDPHFRTQHGAIRTVVQEYVDDLRARGNTEKQAVLVQGRIELVIEKAAFTEYVQVDAVRVVKAIKDLQDKGQFKTTATANKYLEAVRAWTRWMLINHRWDRDPLATACKIKGDTSNTRPRTILSQEAFAQLLRVTRKQPNLRNLSGEQRYWLYLIASQTGLRAQELHSLTPANFHLYEQPPYVEIRNTISKRGKKTGKKDRIELQQAFVAMLRPWLKGQPSDERLWGGSRSWWYKAADILRADLEAAEISHRVQTRDGWAVVDFHSFRGLQVTNAMRTGQPSRIVMEVARLSSEQLLERYVKISESEVTACVEAMPRPPV
jgi:integrase